jgi:hypothetical protein
MFRTGTIRCRECGDDSNDARWSPLCPACHEERTHAQRRAQIRPPELDASGWPDPAALRAGFEAALGSDLPVTQTGVT